MEQCDIPIFIGRAISKRNAMRYCFIGIVIGVNGNKVGFNT